MLCCIDSDIVLENVKFVSKYHQFSVQFLFGHDSLVLFYFFFDLEVVVIYFMTTT